MPREFLRFLESRRQGVEQALDRLLPPPSDPPAVLHRAMRYTALAPGKRVRALITLAVAEMLGRGEKGALEAGAAIEMIHAASLVLDDLPCMDDARLRRGQETCHRVFGEANAILAAIGLLNRGYEVLHEGPALARLAPKLRAEVASCVLDAVGTRGVVGGQTADLEAEGRPVDFHALEWIHRHKTGSLFLAAAEAGALLGGAARREREALRDYARNLGLAFQIVDDLLDVVGLPPGEAAKDIHRDTRRKTFVAFSGIEGARTLAKELVGVSVEALAPFGPRARVLQGMARYVEARAGHGS